MGIIMTWYLRANFLLAQLNWAAYEPEIWIKVLYSMLVLLYSQMMRQLHSLVFLLFTQLT